MDQKKLDEIVRALIAKGVNKPCPRCGNDKFTVVGDGLVQLQEDPTVFAVGGPAVPTVIVACDNCGYVSQHAKGSLGLPKGGQ